MNQDEVLELLDEARQTCGRRAHVLADFCGERLQDDDWVTRRFVTDKIAEFTGKRVELAPYKAATAGFTLCEDCPRPDTCREAARCMCSQIKKFEPPGDVVKQSGQFDEKLTSAHSTGCSWCRRADIDVILGGVVACWAGELGLSVCKTCAQRGLEALEQELCPVCRKPLAIGDWPCITIIRPHGRSVQTTPFVAYFDVALGKEITSLGDRWAAMRPEGSSVHRTADGKEAVTEGRGQLVYRDKMSRGDLAARNDRIHERLRERGRHNEQAISEISHPDTVTVYDDTAPVLFTARRVPLRRQLGFTR